MKAAVSVMGTARDDVRELLARVYRKNKAMHARLKSHPDYEEWARYWGAKFEASCLDADCLCNGGGQ